MADQSNTTPGTPRRRLARAAAVSLAVAALPTGATPAQPPATLLRVLANPARPVEPLSFDGGADAELVRRLGAYVEAARTYNTAPPDAFDGDDDPLWQALVAARTDAEAIAPQTLAGIVAKAVTSVALAMQEPDGDSGWGDGPAGEIAHALVLDVLRLYGPASEA
ncbi:hypothetical protein [Falsiroseomonas tokyonensis]|uniref:Secreted protein n=1 Tax=Falsiroseomonas tokyonensis TaxID=430521 RepID=A0ABV7BV06_9PROT|nr:hypothetical protein [Falsiroseomonas tokyonensis]MBU8539489.1 hypothetical protein [Falsiroseomonas tokyonensis]